MKIYLLIFLLYKKEGYLKYLNSIREKLKLIEKNLTLYVIN